MPPVLSRLRGALLGLLVGLVLVPTVAVGQDLPSVERRIEALQEELNSATARYEQVHDRLDETETRLRRLEGRARNLEQQVSALSATITDRVRALYKQGTDTGLASLVASEDAATMAERAGLLAILQNRDEGQREHAASLRQQLDQTRRLLVDARSELAALEERHAEERATLMAELERARDLARDLRAREARRRRIRRGVQNGVYACIFDRGTTAFGDTWGAPRSGGRRHEGTDLFATRDAPVYAFTNGVISRMSSSGLGGIGLYLRGDDGNVYYYAHLAGYADSAYAGKRVEAGELVAYNGSSGNASRSAPHVHFELHPGGGAPVNPYEWLAAACF